MPTYITVITEGNEDRPHTAVQACNHRLPLERYKFYNSQLRQNFRFADTDRRIGTKAITNIKTGQRINVNMYELQANLQVDPDIKVPGCDMAEAAGLTDTVVNIVDEWNSLNAEKVKLALAKKKFKDSK